MPAPTKQRRRERVRRVQVYLTSSVQQERVLLDLWDAAGDVGRPQEVFRQMLLAGMRAMVDQGTMPAHLLRAVPAVAALASPRAAHAPTPYLPPEPEPVTASPAPAEQHADRTRPPVPEPLKDSPAGLISLMGKRRAKPPLVDAAG